MVVSIMKRNPITVYYYTTDISGEEGALIIWSSIYKCYFKYNITNVISVCYSFVITLTFKAECRLNL